MEKKIIDLFVKFFTDRQHMYINSYPLSTNDATLLFVNSGMAPLKDYFLGNSSPPSKSIVTCQSCLRVGGKHNDIDNIGHTNRHHTFFKMLGNFSFGEYNLKQALKYANDFLNLLFDSEKLWYTYHEKDENAKNILKDISQQRVICMNNQDNKWAMGNYGLFGYSIEIFFSDATEIIKNSDGSLSDNFIEIWNIVYMTHEKRNDDSIIKLKTPSIDTGMGLERIVSILEGHDDTFLSSIFESEFNILAKYVSLNKKSFRQRIIIDHARSVKALLKENLVPSSNKHGYILRMLIRRIIINIYMINKNAIYDFVKDIFDNNSIVINETKAFMKCIEQGIEYIENKKTITEENAFKLYETYGLPIEVTEDLINYKLNKNKIRTLMKNHKLISQNNMKFTKLNHIDFIKTEFVGYNTLKCKANILQIVDCKYIILDKTPFYVESGGQESDHGHIGESKVINVIKNGETILHEVENIENVKLNTEIIAKVNEERRKGLCNAHSATHILNYVLRKNYNAKQSGSLVKNNELRFDFICDTTLNTKMIEMSVNEIINRNINLKCTNENTKLAIERGAVALFTEKYDINSRVIAFDNIIELCCGTHVENTGQIQTFLIHSVSSIAKGVKRICAYVEKKAYEEIYECRNIVNKLFNEFSSKNILNNISKLKNELSLLKNENKNIRKLWINSAVNHEYIENLHYMYFKNLNIADLISLINRKCKISICASDKFIIISGENIEKFVNSLKNSFVGNGGGNKNTFRGSYNIKNYEIFQKWIKSFFNSHLSD